MSEHQSVIEPPHLLGGEIDTHVHATKLPEKGIDTVSALSTAFDAGLSACIDVGLSEVDIEPRTSLLAHFERLFFAHGLYPSNAGRNDLPAAIDRIRQACRSGNRVCAVGEIGIDRYWDYGTPESQRELFADQIALANELHLPVIVHNRDAEEHILDVLAAVRPDYESVMHCYGGPASYIPRFLDHGFAVSFGGNVTFKNARSLREAMLLVPDNKLLLESDAPFLAPHPRRGRPNHPGLVGYTYDSVASHRERTRESLVTLVAANVERVFRLKLQGASEMPSEPD